MAALCLNMIVRNEEKTITRLLDSVRGVVSDYVILDTGSTDSTVDTIRSYPFLKGHVLQEPFVDFGTSRTRALQLARELSSASHLLLLDADMVLRATPDLPLLLDPASVYTLTQKNGGLSYQNVRIVPRLADVTCVGYTHEYYSFPNQQHHLSEEVAYVEDIGDGGSKTDKFERDERLLQLQLERHPGDPRTLFYLAQTAWCLGKLTEAVELYRARLEVGEHFQAEANYCRYRLTVCFLQLGKIAEAEAWAQHPGAGPEAAYRVATYLRETQLDRHRAFHHCLVGLQRLRQPQPFLFVEDEVRSFLLERELTLLWYYVAPTTDNYGLRASWRLLQKEGLPSWAFENVYNNLIFYTEPLKGASVTQLTLDTDTGWTTSTPTTTGRDQYLVRIVNYRLCPETGEYRSSDGGPVDTYYTSWPEGNRVKLDLSRLDESTVRRPDSSVRGVEDLRVSGDRVLGVSREFLAEGQEVSVVLGTLSGNTLSLLCAVRTDRAVEKNWVWTNADGEDSFVYDWFPTVSVATVQNKGLLKVREVPSPPGFRFMRGSSCGAPYNDEVWFVTHSVVPQPGKPRVYLHYLVVFDRLVTTVKRFSAPFTFERPPNTEYCNGLFVDGKGLRFAYSRLDRSSHVLTLPWHSLPPFL